MYKHSGQKKKKNSDTLTWPNFG